jgi:myo-inositol-1(or 4)-monophosphatase
LLASEQTAIAQTLVAAVREAGALALRARQGDLKHWTKGKNSPVSEADLAVDALLRERLRIPGIEWLSEESEDDPARLTAQRVWIVDPIDGTRAYIGGLPDWSISVALVEDGRPTIASVFAPVADEFFFATAGGGATCNGARIRVTSAASLSGARIAGPKRALEALAQTAPGIEAVPRVHSLALRFARVAQGTIDAAIASGDSYDWDLAAADLLVHEAGGTLTTLTGTTTAYNRSEPVHGPLVAAGPGRSQILRDLLSSRQS